MKAAVLLFLLLLAACDRQSPNTTSDPIEKSPEPDTLVSTDDMQTGASDFDRASHPGAELYSAHCDQCHSGTVPKAPHFSWLEMMSASAIYASMTEGIMSVQAAHLSVEEKILITEYIARKHISDDSDLTAYEPTYCDDQTIETDSPAPSVNWGHDTNRFSPADVAGLTADDLRDLELKWSFVYPDAFRARSQPSIAYNTIFTGSQDGTVFAFDLDTGCTKWTFKASAEVRTGIVLSNDTEAPLAFFGDILAKQYAVNARTGELVWSIKADEHPAATLTGTAAYYDGHLYVPLSSLEVIPAADPSYECCTFRGSVLALNAETGEEIWRHYAIEEAPEPVSKTSVGTNVLAPSGAPIWSSPTIDAKRGLLYVGTGENYSSPADGNSDAILAIEMATGQRAWTRQSTAGDAWNVACMMKDNPNCPEEDGPDFDHGSSILLAAVDEVRDILLAGHKNGTIFGLDPDKQAELVWETKVGRGSIQGGVHFGMAIEGTTLYAPINDMNNTRNGDYLDPEKARPGVHAIDISNGEVLWRHVQDNICFPEHEFCDPGISSPVTAMPGALVAGHLDGFVRAYSKEDGQLLFEFDSRGDITGVNGLTGHGGSMSGAGPAIVDGHVVINSGYGLYNHQAGNILLVFAPRGAD